VSRVSTTTGAKGKLDYGETNEGNARENRISRKLKENRAVRKTVEFEIALGSG